MKINIKLLTSIIFSISIFHEVILVDCKKNEYTTYLKEVIHHVRFHIRLLNLKNLSLRTENDDIISIEGVLNHIINDFNKLVITYYNIVDVINYLFIEVLQIFTEHMKIIIDVCENYYKNNLLRNATYCTTVLLNTAKNSNLMFNYLYKAITFIDCLDVNSVWTKSVRPKTVIDEIYIVQNYTFLMKTAEMLNYVDSDENINIPVVKKDYKEINNFVNKVIEITDNFSRNNITIINNTIKCNLQEKYCNEYKSNMYENNFVDYVSEKFNVYCIKTINKYYFDMGFNELLKPYSAQLTPPQITKFPQDKAIKILNTLFHEGNWNLLNHISIISYNEIITLNRIIRDPIDYTNFYLKKKYFTQLIRCRFTEVLKNYNTNMSAVIHILRNEIIKNNLDNIKECTIRFFDAVKESKEMFKYMLLALDKLKATSIWEVMYHSYACLTQTYDILSNFLSKIEQLNLTKYDFLNLSIDDIKLNAYNFLFDFQKTRISFNQMVFHGCDFVKQHCFIKGGVLEKNQLLKSWKDIVLSANTNNTTESRKIMYEYALNQFILFYKNAITNEYFCLGFNKIIISD
ncbi:uncharacterized protein LOC126895142 [Daktulosphaira vitifoliae]|uniref:uncharacterized protein LOC126895142 n=1 Tax=Daktulosphaira vitifoliae TaxID=58002 RepID=UPI0021A9918A|nr:uncharacterized protein LOC126895142 [Daktulosphaira vitifoliae]